MVRGLLGKESDSRDLMAFISKFEKNRSGYWYQNLMNEDNDLPINKRFVRQALFTSELSVLIYRDANDAVAGFLIFADDSTTNLLSRGIVLLVQSKSFPKMVSEATYDVEPDKLPSKLKIAQVEPINFLDEECGFSLEGTLRLIDGVNYFYTIELH